MNNSDIKQLAFEMSQWFKSDNIELLENVMCDSLDNPQYSAITAKRRIQLYIKFMRKYDPSYKINTVSELLLNSGYTEEFVRVFAQKIRNEMPLRKEIWGKAL